MLGRGARKALSGIHYPSAIQRGFGTRWALHGLRHSVLPPKVPRQQHHPGWNDLVYRDKWRPALEALHSTNNFPEFTGRICPAPCRSFPACTLNINDLPVTIKTIECAIVDRGWEEGWIKPQPAAHHTDKRVAVIGSGPAGLTDCSAIGSCRPQGRGL